MYDSKTNHTKQLALALSKGITVGGSSVQMFHVQSADAPQYVDVAKVHGLAIGSPTYFGNPSAATLSWIANSLGDGWTNRIFADVPGAVFATGGGYHQGTEHVLSSLTRGLLNFGYRMVTPNVEVSGYFGSFGASAVTGTPPYFIDAAPVDEGFIEATTAFGTKMAKAVQQEWHFRCDNTTR